MKYLNGNKLELAFLTIRERKKRSEINETVRAKQQKLKATT